MYFIWNLRKFNLSREREEEEEEMQDIRENDRSCVRLQKLSIIIGWLEGSEDARKRLSAGRWRLIKDSLSSLFAV